MISLVPVFFSFKEILTAVLVHSTDSPLEPDVHQLQQYLCSNKKQKTSETTLQKIQYSTVSAWMTLYIRLPMNRKLKRQFKTCDKPSRLGSFSLTKFVSNSVQRLSKIPKENCDNEKDKHRVLCVMWNTVNDTFFRQKLAKVQEDKTQYTLRKLPSLIACLFDPIGIIAPLLITLKIILQDTWKKELAWDDLLSDEKQKSIETFIEQYLNVPAIAIPRYFVPPNKPSPTNQLHCFCDASQLAYGAVIYFRFQSANTISTGFVTA